MTDPFVGRTIDHYDVVEKLGGGGMGVVYRARDTKLGRHVALKFLPPQWAHDEEAKQRFIREAQAASATDHRNVCTIHDIGETGDGHLFIVMALYEGPTLKQRLHAGPLEIDDALDIATQVAEGLAKAHGSGVVHRDVKPGNLILTEDAVKIVDFGLATFSAALQLTIEGSTLGTAAYMSPEQSRGEEVGPATDVWAVGVILYEMLTGHPPFPGGSPDAVSYAIRHDAPAPLRSARPGVPEDVEQLVFRALMKDPRLRYASGRELARALRHARGQTLPQDLLTRAIQVPSTVPSALLALTPAPRRRSRTAWGVAAAVALAVIGGGWWALQPPERQLVLVAPVANQTGEAALDSYRLALTHAMVRALNESPTVRPVAYEKMLQSLRKYIGGAADIGSRDALQALIAASGTQVVAMPTLLYDDADRTWRGRVEFRDASTATATASYETPRVTSALSKDTAYELAHQLVALVNAHMGPGRVRAWFSQERAAPQLASIEAEKAFESGISWYEEQEYGLALDAFQEASKQDGQNPLLYAWVSRTALVMRNDAVARDAAERASQLTSNAIGPTERMFVFAVVAEARQERDRVEEQIRELAKLEPEEARWRLELAAFHQRQRESDVWIEAVAEYHQALALEPDLVRPHIELCRLYNRLQEPANALSQGQAGLSGARTTGWRGAEALSLFCLVDRYRTGSPAERTEAETLAAEALRILRDLGFPYNLARALYYAGTAAGVQGRFSEAASLTDQALAVAQKSGNLELQPLLQMNLGVIAERQGAIDRAVSFYRRSADTFQRVGDERRAAQQQANSGALRIAYGIEVDVAFRDVQNALAVVRRLGDTTFEVNCLEAIGAYYRHAGRFEEAERDLNVALSLAKSRSLGQRVSTATLALARVSFERGDYATARRRALEVIGEGARTGAQAVTLLGRIHTRLGAFDEATKNFVDAEADIAKRRDLDLRAPLEFARGELAYESNRRADARAHFADVVKSANPADDVVVWSRSYLALLEALDGRRPEARSMLEASVREAQRRRRVILELTSRVFLARTNLIDRRLDAAKADLGEQADAREVGLGTELRAYLAYWRSRAGAADRVGGESGVNEARALIEDLRRSLPESYRDRFAARPDIRVILGRAQSVLARPDRRCTLRVATFTPAAAGRLIERGTAWQTTTGETLAVMEAFVGRSEAATRSRRRARPSGRLSRPPSSPSFRSRVAPAAWVWTTALEEISISASCRRRTCPSNAS
jgi:tetratricopeptide (TPR) repeat protein/tRNA A-37 threonylcarbamoyl transferase component Bud32